MADESGMKVELERLLSALRSDDIIPASLIQGPMADEDLRVRGVAYHVLQRARERIDPPLSTAAQCSFMLDYLFDCILRNPESDDYQFSGFEAAWELAGWVKQLEGVGRNEAFVSHIIQRLTAAYRTAEETTRNRIETGVVEHLMERPSLREYFAAWKGDPTLGRAYELCLHWGKCHEEG